MMRRACTRWSRWSTKCHLIEGIPVLCLGRYPVGQAITEEWPKLSTEGWWKLAIAFSQQNMEQLRLRSIFDLSTRELAKL